MGPKVRFGNKGKGVASSSDARYQRTFPWPREEHTPFDLEKDGLPLASDAVWDQIDAEHYNRLLQLNLQPTRFLCEQTLEQLGIKDQVRHMLYQAHCMSFALEEDVLYPDLTRQCLATATLVHANPENPTLDGASFAFFAGGKQYSIPMREFCVIYGFREEVQQLQTPKFKESKSFWSLIASGNYSSNSASQNSLRHPALRIAARIFCNMLSARSEGNKVHIDELMLLFLGVGHIVGRGMPSDHFDHYRCNLGMRFAEKLCAIRKAPTLTRQGPRTERVGSLLTPLFRHLKVNLRDYYCVDEMSKLDLQHLIFSKIITKGGLYRFTSTTGEDQFISLPNPIVQLNTEEDLAFHPAPEHLAPDPRRPSTSATPSIRSLGGPSQPSTCSPDSTVPRLTYYADTAADDQGEFDLPPIADNADDAEYRRWMITSTKKNNSLLKRIMETLSKGCCHSTAAKDAQPPPSPPSAPTPPPAVAATSATPPSASKKRRTRSDASSSR